jgi:hypothetical protein
MTLTTYTLLVTSLPSYGLQRPVRGALLSKEIFLPFREMTRAKCTSVQPGMSSPGTYDYRPTTYSTPSLCCKHRIWFPGTFGQTLIGGTAHEWPSAEFGGWGGRI